MLVERYSGEPLRVGPIPHNERSAETIRRFTATTLTMLMNWSGQLPPEDLAQINKPRPDAGYSINGSSSRVTTAAWQASASLSADFRGKFLEKLAQLTPAGVFGGNTQTVFTVSHTSDPQKLGEGRWRVDVVANLDIYQKGEIVKPLSFNKSVFLRAVDPPVVPGSTPLEVQVYSIRQAGLEIYAIRDLERGNL